MSSHNVLRLKLIYQYFCDVTIMEHHGFPSCLGMVSSFIYRAPFLYLAACVSINGQCANALCNLTFVAKGMHVS